ncbi:unnamed protein product [Chilo suppressalis]|uniref:Uncharacterized protein n=1 Tax=Chilo suppressalis TaxID=168631 RepID=A0ABN8AP45_CHISP|nr:unnamed protein product [Chilo suppressalis]
MVRGAALALLALTACYARASVLVPTYVLPPDSFVRDQRSLGPPPDTETAESTRTIKRLIGGHMKIKSDKEYSSVKNSIDFEEKPSSGKFNGVIAPDQSGGTVGWNQGIWDDGMLMSSAGEGKETVKTKEDDEDKKTLSDQVAEGKYGLIQNEIFSKTPKRPGIVSYEPNSETRQKDNLQTLGGLKKDEIWLAEDHLLVLKGGSFPERTKESEHKPWPPIDAYEAPRRQVKLPQKPKVPPPFPVRLTDDGPLIFLTPNGSVPAALFPPFPAGEGEGPLYPPPFAFAPGAPYAPGDYPGNSTAGGSPLPIPPFPFLPGNASEGPFTFPASMNGSFPEGFPPGAAFLPPPSNQTDLYDEDDPSIYYPPPYNFSYRADYNNSVPAGPLVPGIILPPPPDFFAPVEEKAESSRTTTRPTTVPTYTRYKTTVTTSTTPVYRNKYKTRPTTTTTEPTRTTETPTTITTPPPVEIVTYEPPKIRKPQRIPSRTPIRVQNLPDEITARPKTEKPIYKTRTKVTSKPLSVSVIYDYPEEHNTKVPTTTEYPYIVYNLPEKSPNVLINEPVTSTPVPLRAYYSNNQNNIPTTKLQPVFNRKPNENAVASFYFYDEQPKTSPSPATYFDGRNYYKTVPSNSPQYQQQNVQQQSGFAPSVDVAYGAIDQADALFLWPQKQGPRTLTQEYFSIQKPRLQQTYVQQNKQRPETFYQQIADIQQTIDLFTTKRPKSYSHRPHLHKPKAITSRPVYQFSYQSQSRPEQLTFRAPKLDPEPFRPMVSYSKPFNLQNEFNAITPSVSPGYHQQYLIENVQVTTETPNPTRFYPKTKIRNEDYADAHVSKDVRPKGNRNHIPIQNDKPAAHHVTRYPSTTANPISHGYYTKQDERYLDDITKNSFDVFGKKLEDNTYDVNSLAVTEPLETVKTPIDNDPNQRFAYDIIEQQGNPPSLDRDTLVNDRLPRPTVNPDSEPIAPHKAELVEQNPPSLLHDTLVNDRFPRPPLNPDSEFVPIANPQQYRVQSQEQRTQYTGEQYDLNRPSLAGDTAVNYARPLPPVNPDAEWIAPVNAAGEGRPGSYVSYRLPGEGAHVYFLTPQAAQAAQAARERYRAPGYGR